AWFLCLSTQRAASRALLDLLESPFPRAHPRPAGTGRSARICVYPPAAPYQGHGASCPTLCPLSSGCVYLSAIPGYGRWSPRWWALPRRRLPTALPILHYTSTTDRVPPAAAAPRAPA